VADKTDRTGDKVEEETETRVLTQDCGRRFIATRRMEQLTIALNALEASC